MLVRIVKMSFHEENIPAFLENFEIMKEKIRNSNGNRFLELYQDKNNKSIFFTYSYWETEEDLKITEIQHFLMKFGHLQKNYSIANPKLGALIN